MQTNNDEDSAWLTNHEEEFLQNVDDDYEIARSRLDREKEQSIKNIWTYFQDSAQYITQLYKGKSSEKNIKIFYQMRKKPNSKAILSIPYLE